MHCCLSVSLLALSFHLSILLSSVCLCLRNCLSSLSKCVTKSTSLRFVLCVVCDAACGYVPVLDTSGVFSVRGTAVRPKCSPLPLACLPPTHTRPPHNWQKGHFREPVSCVCFMSAHTPRYAHLCSSILPRAAPCARTQMCCAQGIGVGAPDMFDSFRNSNSRRQQSAFAKKIEAKKSNR